MVSASGFSALDWGLLAAAALLTGGLTLWTLRRTRSAIRAWVDHAVLRAVRRFQVRLDRYKLVSKRTVRGDLLADAEVRTAIAADAATRGVSEMDSRVRVERYVDEIVPQFNVLSYYRVGYNIARVLVNLLYRVSAGARDARGESPAKGPEGGPSRGTGSGSAETPREMGRPAGFPAHLPAASPPDRGPLNRVAKRDIVVYLMNHRSNADYIVLAYVLAHAVSISYAVGEWARVWPLEYVFKSFGAYFVRRGYRDPLYHTVLRRYVQLITRNGVTQGIFLEGGLSRDGKLRPAKIGLLDGIAGTLSELPPDRDIWLVPVALNYDRVLEDRSLIRELVDPEDRPSRARQFGTVLSYLTHNLLRIMTGNLKRYGRVAVNFGSPISLRRWAAAHSGVLELSRERRLPFVQSLADGVMARLADLVPVTPVPLTAAALLSFGETVVRRDALLERLGEYRDHLAGRGAHLVQPERDAALILDRASRTLAMRRLVAWEGGSYVVLPRQRPLLEYYANSVKHLLPAPVAALAMHPAREPDRGLPGLRPPSAG